MRCPENVVALKPASLSWEEAASIPLPAMTVLQALKKYDGDLEGKTVLIPAGREFKLPFFGYIMLFN